MWANGDFFGSMTSRGWVRYVALGGLLAALSVSAAGNRYIRCPADYEASAQRCERIAKHSSRPNKRAREASGDSDQQPKTPDNQATAVESQEQAVARERERQEANQREKDDLDAQRVMAKAALQSNVIAWWELAVAIAGAGGLIASLWMTREALNLTRQQMKESRDASERELRAYVSLGELRRDKEPPNYHRILAANDGSTPAHKLRAYMNIYAMAGAGTRLPQDFGYPDLSKESEGNSASVITVGSGRNWDFHFVVEHEDYLERARKSEITLYLYGHVDYFDIFGREHTTEFCYCVFQTGQLDEAGKSRLSLKIYDQHNGAT